MSSLILYCRVRCEKRISYFETKGFIRALLAVQRSRTRVQIDDAILQTGNAK
jgi:hypothetical protein